MRTEDSKIKHIRKLNSELGSLETEYIRQRKLVHGTLTAALIAFFDSYPASLREIARKMGLSVAYLSDIKHGRRVVTDSVVEKLEELR